MDVRIGFKRVAAVTLTISQRKARQFARDYGLHNQEDVLVKVRQFIFNGVKQRLILLLGGQDPPRSRSMAKCAKSQSR